MRSSSATPMAHRRCRSRARPATWYSPPRRGRRRGIWSRPADERGPKRATWSSRSPGLTATGRLSTSDDLRAQAAAELARAGRPADRIAPKTLVPSGETRDIHRAGGRYVTLVGSNPLFHLPQDRWPHAVDAAAVAHIAAAAAEIV